MWCGIIGSAAFCFVGRRDCGLLRRNLGVLLAMLLLIILENIDGTRTLSVLMRFTGKEETDPSANDG